jgi:tRNA threonylcarbamoyladenosine biosynthesis protein TsaE
MIEPRTLICHHPGELPALARELLREAAGRQVFLLQGDLGAGKTALVRALVEALGSADAVSSPTFALVQSYALPGQDPDLAHHLDAYRVRDEAEAEEAGLPGYLEGREWAFVEWPEVLAPWWPDQRVEVHLEILPDASRKIVFLVL